MKNTLVILLISVVVSSCGVYSMRMIADDSGAETFSVDYFKPQTPKATQVFTARFTDEFRDFINDQSSLTWVNEKGDLRFEGAVTGYQVRTKGVQSDETASLNELSITVKVKYTNTIEEDKSFEKSFTKFALYNSSQELFEVEEELWNDIIEQLLQAVYNESLGNW